MWKETGRLEGRMEVVEVVCVVARKEAGSKVVCLDGERPEGVCLGELKEEVAYSGKCTLQSRTRC